jgi:hypothetical protein
MSADLMQMASPSDEKETERLRALASYHRETAKRLSNPAAQRQMLQWANFYEAKARQIEEAGRKKSGQL